MKKTIPRHLCLFVFLFFSIIAYTQEPSAILELISSEQGILIPRTDTSSVNASNTPAKGLIIYQSIDSTFYFFNGSYWVNLIEGDNMGNEVSLKNLSLSNNKLNSDDDEGIYISDAGSVGIGLGALPGKFSVTKSSDFNIAGTDSDFQVKSDNDENMLFVDGGQDRIGIGTDSPQSRFHYIDNGDGVRLDGSISQMSFFNGATGLGYLKYDNVDMSLFNQIKGNLLFGTDDQTKMVIDSCGHLGIGELLPDESLTLEAGNLLQKPADLAIANIIDNSGIRGIYVSGRYSYIIIGAGGPSVADTLKIMDLSDPNIPITIASKTIGRNASGIYVAGRYAYIIDTQDWDFEIYDISNPSLPTKLASLGSFPEVSNIYVSGKYAYLSGWFGKKVWVVDISNPLEPSELSEIFIESAYGLHVSGKYIYNVETKTDGLNVLDMSNPWQPRFAGSVGVGANPKKIYVSGRYAYIRNSGELKIVDISNPSLPIVVGSLAIGGSSKPLYVTGDYVYTIEATPIYQLLKIGVADPTNPIRLDSVIMSGNDPRSLFVSANHIYTPTTHNMNILKTSKTEVGSIITPSIESSNFQIINDQNIQGQLSVYGGINIGSGGLFSDGNVGVAGTFSLSNDIPPSSSPTGIVQVYAEDVAGSSELKVRDAAGNTTTISPHNRSLLPKPYHPLAWSYYSENENGTINVDMFKFVELIEDLSGKKLIYTELNNNQTSNELQKAYNLKFTEQEAQIDQLSEEINALSLIIKDNFNNQKIQK